MFRSTAVAGLSVFLSVLLYCQPPSQTAGSQLPLPLAQQSGPVSSAQNNPAMTVTVSDGDNGKSIKVPLNGTLQVTLTSNASAGYRWSLRGDPSPLMMVHSSTSDAGEAPVVGAAGKQEFKLTATNKGTAIVKFEYARAWEKNTAPAKTFWVKVLVY